MSLAKALVLARYVRAHNNHAAVVSGDGGCLVLIGLPWNTASARKHGMSWATVGTLRAARFVLGY